MRDADSDQPPPRADGGRTGDKTVPPGSGRPMEQPAARPERAETPSEALRVSELVYRRLFEAARDGILILDFATGRIVDVNPFLVELLGASRDEMVGKTVGELSPFKDLVANQRVLERLQREGYVRYENLPLETSDGRRIAVEFVSNVYQAGDEKVIQCNIRDITDRRQLETALLHLRSIVESSADAIVGKDLSGIITSWNKGAEKIFGYTAGEMVGASILRLIPADRQDEESKILEKLHRGESVDNLETVRQTKGGKLISVSVTICPIKDINGKIVGASKVAQDITLRKEHEREIERLSRLYAALSQVNQAIVTVHNREELFAKICRVLVETGKFRMAWVGWLDAATRRVIPVAQWGESVHYLSQAIIYADDRPEGQGPTGTAIREERDYVCNDFNHDPRTLPWRQAAEQAGWQSSAAFPIRLRGVICGAITVYAGQTDFFHDKEIALLEEVAADTSFALDNYVREVARRQSEIVLRWKTAFLEAQVDSSLDGILVVDDQGNNILQNQRLSELWKIPPPIANDPNEAVQIEFITKRTKNPREFAEKVAWLSAHPDEISRDEIELLDGTILDRYSSPVRDKDGTHYGRVWTFRDVTERRKLEAQLYQSQKMESIGQLAGGIAHDFNNIIGVILMQSELAEMFVNSPEKVREGLLEIKASAERAANLTRQLLLFSRQEVMQLRQLDLNDVVTGLAGMLRRIIRQDVTLELHVHSAPLRTFADAGMIEQLLMNLAVNARDAMPTGGRIVIETAEKVIGPELAELNPEASPGRYVWLSVSDTGCGIPPEIQARIFEPFFTTKEAGKGTGLGLATVFGIVKQHHGWLRVYSEVGKGTNFQVFLPASDAPAEALSTASAKPKPRGGSETILIAEDYDILRMLTRATLETGGYQVLVTASGVEAELAWNEHQGRIDLLLTDLVMPGGVNGQELAARLQRQSPGVKVLFISGYSAEIAGRELKLQAGQLFLQKPYSSAALLEAVRNCLDL